MSAADTRTALITLLCLGLANEQTPENFQVAVQKGYLKITGLDKEEPLYLPTADGKKAAVEFLMDAGLVPK